MLAFAVCPLTRRCPRRATWHELTNLRPKDDSIVLTSVRITNYRGFREFKLRDLAPVNLLVGKNNSGKTALLEAIHLLASGGNPSILTAVARRRSEYVLGKDFDEPPHELIDISHFFHGHEVGAGTEFSVAGENQLPAVTVKAVQAEELDAELPFENFAMRRTRSLWESSESPLLAMRIEVGTSTSTQGSTFLLSESGALLVDPRRPHSTRRWLEEQRSRPPTVYISPDASMTESLATMWDLVLRDKREKEVRAAMQILEPELQDVVFQAGEGSRRVRSSVGILIGFQNDSRRVPLGSMGDGMRRLLGLSLSLLHARSGFLLIDEIDTGFHYSIMAKMWELVVKTAVESNTQVFATTHSADCVRGLGVLCKRMPQFRNKVAAHKIERESKSSIAFTGDDVLNALEHDIEIR